MNKSLRIRFWGTRGSIPKPGASTVRYGGNTSCVEFQSSSGTLLIIDCGTGAYALGQKLMKPETPFSNGHILISHTHWDHIQGIPFFAPFFNTETQWDIYGPRGLGQSIKDTLAGQMQYTYFPVSLDQASAHIRYHDITEGVFEVGDIKVTTQYLNHTALTCGYRLEVDGIVVVYSCDHEPHSPILARGEGEITGRDQQHAKFFAHADLVIHDAQYTAEEYPAKIGWGHSTIEYAVKVCQYARVKRLALTHHDPLRSDDAVDRLLHDIHKKLDGEGGSPLQVFAAAENQEIFLTSKKIKITRSDAKKDAVDTISTSALTKQLVFIYVKDSEISTLLTEVLSSDNIPIRFVSDTDAIRKSVLEEHPSLILIEHNLSHIDGLAICRHIRKDIRHCEEQPSIVMIAAQEDSAGGKEAGVTDWLITPFTSSYLRSKIQALILRISCRWIKAPIPDDEQFRLASLHKLNILDTAPEERFDRITRIAAALFDVPMALITLIDKDRQWFKSHFGINNNEGSRDVSICAHVVYHRTNMIIPDTLKDERFADNPLVVNKPSVRFYVGCPLILSDGACIGTLCLIDKRPHFFEKSDVKLLEDLRDLVLNELQHNI